MVSITLISIPMYAWINKCKLDAMNCKTLIVVIYIENVHTTYIVMKIITQNYILFFKPNNSHTCTKTCHIILIQGITHTRHII